MSSGEAGAPVAVVQQAAQGVEYAAKITDDTHWTAEWRIPLASLELDMATTPVFPFNLAIRKTAGPEWVLWVGTNHATWNVANAGFLALIP